MEEAVRESLLQAGGAMSSAMHQHVLSVLDSTDREPRANFRKHFSTEIDNIAKSTALALTMCNLFLHRMEPSDSARIQVLGILHTSISLQLTSTKLFVLGHTVAAGAVFRQVMEGVSLAILCSARTLPYQSRFEAGTYTANGAVTDLKRNALAANVRPEAMKVVMEAYQFYHRYAHISKLSMAACYDFSINGPHLGAFFDSKKLPEYAKEVRNRAKFAARVPEAVVVVARNLALWRQKAPPPAGPATS